MSPAKINYRKVLKIYDKLMAPGSTLILQDLKKYLILPETLPCLIVGGQIAHFGKKTSQAHLINLRE